MPHESALRAGSRPHEPATPLLSDHLHVPALSDLGVRGTESPAFLVEHRFEVPLGPMLGSRSMEHGLEALRFPCGR